MLKKKLSSIFVSPVSVFSVSLSPSSLPSFASECPCCVCPWPAFLHASVSVVRAVLWLFYQPSTYSHSHLILKEKKQGGRREGRREGGGWKNKY